MEASVCRVVVDLEPRVGTVNMAIDAALLRVADDEPSAPIVRVYQWAEPTVSLGYFQNSDPSCVEPLLASCPRVRRLTGGGAILHHHEITYSCVIPRNHKLREQPLQLYSVIHRSILEVLAACGASVGFRRDCPGSIGTVDACSAVEQEPFLCFLRSDPRDLAAIGGEPDGYPKVVGSAQRRRRGTILQHGSILLQCSELLPDVLGVCDLFPQFDLSAFLNLLPTQLAVSVSDGWISSAYTERERYFAFDSLKPENPDIANGTETTLKF
jgi:lipoate-protein ligase A